MRKFKILVLLFSLLVCNAKAQTDPVNNSIIPMSPNAAALATYADYPVSYYTGVPNISIPLYEINVDGFKLPISLSYHASGIKVSQEASWVGLGWALNTGGAISRSVKCIDDFDEYGMSSISNSSNGWYYEDIPLANPIYDDGESTTYNSTFFEMMNGTNNMQIVDSEPDIFYYSLPGLSGKFIYNKPKTPILFDKSHNLKIELKNDEPKVYFIVTTLDGVKYYFKNIEITETYSKGGDMDAPDEELSIEALSSKYTSSWFLTKIETTNNRVIDFFYDIETTKSPTQESLKKNNEVYHDSNGTCPNYSGESLLDYSQSKSLTYGFRLNRIEWDNGKVVFSTSDRNDQLPINSSNPPKKLDIIAVYDKNNNIIKNFKFEYDYFNASSSGTYQYLYKRLKLNKVVEVNEIGEDLNNGYQFSYFNFNLPAKNSKNTDYWGYNNGKNYGADSYYSAYFSGSKIFDGAEKRSDFNYMKFGTLNEIIFPTGESSKFTYKSNSYNSSSFDLLIPTKLNKYYNVFNKVSSNNENYPNSSPAISDTINIDRYGDVSISVHMYNVMENENPFPTYLDIFRIRKIETPYNDVFVAVTPYFNGEDDQDSDDYEYTHDYGKFYLEPGRYVIESYNNLNDIDINWTLRYNLVNNIEEPHGGGLRIKQIQAGNKTRNFNYIDGVLLIDPIINYTKQIGCSYYSTYANYLYSIQLSEPTLSLSTLQNGNSVGYSEVEELVIDGIETSKTVYQYYNDPEERPYFDYPFAPAKVNFINGNLKQVDFYKNDTPVKRTVYTYNTDYSPTIYSFMCTNPVDVTRVYICDFNIEWPKKTKEVMTNYFYNPSRMMTEEYNFTYNTNDLLSSKSLTLNAGGHNNIHAQKIFYPTDYEDAISQSMEVRNMVGVPVENITLWNGNVISGQKTIFQDASGLIVPQTILKLEPSHPLLENNFNYSSAYKPQLFYDLYNKWGKVLQLRTLSSTNVYLWGYQGEYPVAEIKNATYAEVAAILGESFITNLCDATLPSAGDIATIQALNTNSSLSNAQITTYTYKPLVGMVTATDARGVTTNYTYDEFQRLFQITDNQDKVLNEYNYHYQE